MSYRKTANSGDNKNIQVPSIPQNSKMVSYDYIYDENVKQMRAGFKKNKTYYFNSEQDTKWTVTAEYAHRMDLISYKFYNTSVYDWVLEDVNDIKDPIKDVVAGTILIIPLHSNLLGYTIG
jgi:hypothetical protein